MLCADPAPEKLMATNSTVPVHLLNVHAALSAETEFDRAAAAMDATAEALRATRAMQNEFVCDTFRRQLEEPPAVRAEGAPRRREGLACYMHTVLSSDSSDVPCERTDAVLVPAGASPQEMVLYQTRFLCNDNAFWDTLPAGLRGAFNSHMRDAA